jgi:hypothetical protein
MQSDTSQTEQTTTPREGSRPETLVPQAAESGPEGLSPEERAAKKTQTMIIVGAVVFLLLLVGAVVLMASFPSATEVIRDIAIVFVAVTTFLIGLAMLLLIFQIQVLIQVLRDEIQPLLRSVNETASTVRGTTSFVIHSVVSPLIKAAGFTAGVGRVVRDVFGLAKAARPRRMTHTHNGSEGGKEHVEPRG